MPDHLKEMQKIRKKKYRLDLFGVLGDSWSIIDFATNLILHWEEVIELVVGELSWDNTPTEPKHTSEKSKRQKDNTPTEPKHTSEEKN